MASATLTSVFSNNRAATPVQQGKSLAFQQGKSLALDAVLQGKSLALEIVAPRSARASAGEAAHQYSMSDIRFDLLQLREWFNVMDVDRNGCIGKGEFMEFLKHRPRLQFLLVEGCVAPETIWRHGPQEKAVIWRRQSSTWKELSCGEENVKWSGFVDFFRKRGLVVDYKTKDNPKDRLADLVADIHVKRMQQDCQTLEEFVHLRRSHLQGKQKHRLKTLDTPRSSAAVSPCSTAASPCSETSTWRPSTRSSSRHNSLVSRHSRSVSRHSFFL